MAFNCPIASRDVTGIRVDTERSNSASPDETVPQTGFSTQRASLSIANLLANNVSDTKAGPQ